MKIAERAIAEPYGRWRNGHPREPGGFSVGRAPCVRLVSVGAATNLSPSLIQTGHSGPAVLNRCGGTYWSDFTMAPVIWSVKRGRRGGRHS